MSAANRGRKGTNKNTPQLRVLPDLQEKCDCPACSGEVDPLRMIDDTIADAAELLEIDDPLDVELAGAAFLAIVELAGDGYEDLLADGFIPRFEERVSAGSLAILLAIGSVGGGRVGKAAMAAADRLTAAGVPQPGWAVELAEPVKIGDHWRLRDPEGTWSALGCTFHRAGRAHALVAMVNHLNCDAADDVMLVEAEQLPDVLAQIQAGGGVKDKLKPAELRWQFEQALDARAVHDRDDAEAQFQDSMAEDGPDYHTLAWLLRARMTALPAPTRPRTLHGSKAHQSSALDALLRLAGSIGADPFGPVQLGPMEKKLPAKRKKGQGHAPVYQLKVGLRYAKPPIWRRLEVPADISLAKLHAVIQAAFGWQDSHLHVFQTPYGDFGISDPELGFRAEKPVSLEQVAPGEKSKIRYVYDFGDDWEHEILVEKVLDRDKSVTYPRCTGGRRATPPEDCGGIGGYQYLVEILADRNHPEHADRLDWLGLDDASEFDPAAFDPQEITEALPRLRS